MLKSRGPETLQRSSSPRARAPLRDKTNTCSPSNAVPHRKSKPEIGPRTGPYCEKKRGSKMADLEKMLNKAREEVKMLRDQLALAESNKQEIVNDSNNVDEPVIKENDSEIKVAEIANNSTEIANESQEIEEQQSPEVVELKAKLLVKEEEIEFLLQENMIFKEKATEEADGIAAAAKTKQEELLGKLKSMEEELRASKERQEQIREQIEVAEAAKAEKELDMRRMKAQSEQWRKAAEAAAAVMGIGKGIARVGECRKSMDGNLGSGGYGEGRMSSVGELGDGGKRKGGGIRIFGDLLRKKGQQHK